MVAKLQENSFSHEQQEGMGMLPVQTVNCPKQRDLIGTLAKIPNWGKLTAGISPEADTDI